MSTKVAPWLQGLSDGWEPPSDHVTQDPVSSASHDAGSIRRSASRIPRRSLSGLPSSIRSHGNSSQTSVQRMRSPLASVSNNDVNSLRRQDGMEKAAGTRSFSGTTNGGSVDAGTVQQRSKSASPAKKGETLEWKRRLLNKNLGYGDQTDLFGPSGLENIFAKGREVENERPVSRDRASWLQQKSDLPMPSSPPPWPSEVEVRPAQGGDRGALESVLEEDSGYDREASFRSNPFDLECSRLSNVQQTTGAQATDIPQWSPNKAFLEPSSFVRNGNRTVSGQTELEQEGFSPVFITKNTSGDRKIDYAPLNSRAVNGQRSARSSHRDEPSESSGSSQVEVTGIDSGVRNASPEEPLKQQTDSSDLSFSENLLTGSPVPNVGRHVELQRGGYSQYGSFKQRLLSSSQPSDSAPDERVEDPEMIDVDNVPNGHRNTKTPEPASASPKRPSGSPLKLFGDHDTFTNTRLLRRLSQLNPDGTLAKRPQTPSPSITRSRPEAHAHSPNRHVSQQSSFGNGDLDNHSFNAEITITSPSNSEKADSEGSPGSDVPVPGSKIPLGFQFDQPLEASGRSSLRQRSPRQNRVDTSEVSHYGTQLAHFPRPATVEQLSEVQIGSEIDARNLTGGKRPPTSPYKDHNPKRRRTLHASEMETELKEANKSFQDGLRNGDNSRKRKDARPGVAQNTAEPDVLASRKILRPRNPTPAQAQKQQINAELREAAEAFAAQKGDNLEAVLEQIESSITSDSEDSLQQQAESLATEVAAFTLNVRKPSAGGGERKRSVTTQDFLNEAMMVMKLIRAKARPQSNLGSVEESASNASDAVEPVSEILMSDKSESMLRVSRPPSRDGSGWRPRSQAQHTDARVVSHLRKFQEEEEKDDTDFIANTLASLQVDEEAVANENVVVVDEHANIRITGPHADIILERDAVDTRPTSQRSDGTNLNTQNSATTSTGHTIATSSTRKSENVGTLAPDAVAHLIGEQVGGMTFDKEKQCWIRRAKSPERKKNSFLELPSTATSDDDPFREISDLAVDEQVELRRISSPGKIAQAQAAALSLGGFSKSSVNDYGEEQHDQDSAAETRTASNETVVPHQPARDHIPSVHYFNSSSAPSRYSALASSQQEKIETRATSWNDEELAHISTAGRTKQQPLASTVANALLNHYGGPSVSTVPEVHEEPDSGIDATTNEVDDELSVGVTDSLNEIPDERPSGLREDTAVDMEDSEVEELDSPKLRRTPNEAMFHPTSKYSTGLRQLSLRQQTLRSRFMADAREQSELSVIAPLPGDRMMSLSLSVTRPMAARPQNRNITALRSSPSRGDSTFLLSDLPDFTIHEEDNERPSEKALAVRLAKHAAAEINDRYTLAVKEIVKTLTDVKEDEPYWEDVKTLDLKDRSLASVYGLEDFCSGVQDLDISANSLTHLQGAPMTIRTLVASSNLLTSLTQWGHLMNLQYLDISHNQLDDLNGLGCLIHLRELRADDNQIDDLSGILELDGLLKLRLRRNRLQFVDFANSALHRLVELDLSGNKITEVSHAHHLTSLRTLKLGGNILKDGLNVSQSMSSMRHLSMQRCQMENLTVSLLPNLVHLDVDDNSLANVTGLHTLKSLDVLSMRRQTLPTGETISAFNNHLEARTVRLSGNSLRVLNLPNAHLSLQNLELASCGLEQIPQDFGLKLPNLRSLNLNFNSLKDVRPLLNIQKLERLTICGNRLERLRKSIAVFARLKHLSALDLRDNPITQRFHAPLLGATTSQQQQQQTGLVQRFTDTREQDGDAEDLEAERQEEAKYLLPPCCADQDAQHLSRLDQETRLRRRVFELLLANSCRSLTFLNGLDFDRQRPLVKDEVWIRLVELGVIRKTDRDADE